MIVNEEEALERVNSKENLTYKLRQLHAGRTGPKNIPPMIKALAVSISKVDTQENAGEAFGLSQQAISQYANGKHKDTEAKDLIKKSIASVHEKALDGMLSCLDFIKPKLENVKKATELSSIASNLARVVEKTSPKEANVTTNVQIVVHQPRSHSEEEYESIAV